MPVAWPRPACNLFKISVVAAENWGNVAVLVVDAGNEVVCDAHGAGGIGTFEGADCGVEVERLSSAPPAGWGLGGLAGAVGAGGGFVGSIAQSEGLRRVDVSMDCGLALWERLRGRTGGSWS